MAVTDVVQLGEEILREKASEVDLTNKELIKRVFNDLRDTMRQAGLVGLAAPQVGEGVRMFVTELRETPDRSGIHDELRVYINPEIVEMSDDEVEIYEGCGSIVEGQLFGPVNRSKVVTVEAFDIEGKRFRLKTDGILGRVILHEYDHLEGVLFTDLVEDVKRLVGSGYYRRVVKPKMARVSEVRVKDYVVL